MPPGHLELLMHRASRAGALLIPVTDPGDRYYLARAISQAAQQQEHGPEYSAELAIWAGRGRAAEDGVLAASAPPDPAVHGDTRMRTFPHGTLASSTVDTRDSDAGVLLVLATPDDDARSRLRAGEAGSAVLLTATDLTLATCPLSQALEVADTRAAIRELVLDDAAVPAADPARRLGADRGPAGAARRLCGGLNRRRAPRGRLWTPRA